MDLKSKSALKECILEEKNKIFSNMNKKNVLWCYLVNDHWVQLYKYQKYLRYELYHRKKNDNIFHRLLEIYYARKKNNLGNRLGLYIGCEVFDRGLVIYHHGSVIVNGTSRVGKNCQLHGENCIGNNGKTLGTPAIGNNVEFGIGAKVIGDVTIADSITIAAGAVVVDSFLEEGITIGGVPARRIK